MELLPLLTVEVQQRFWAKVQVIHDEDSCWEWTASKNKWGYGKFGVKGKHLGSHRVALTLHNNQEIPDGLSVLHRCDNPTCVRPSHLFTGTQKDNMQDKAAKGRVINQWTVCPDEFLAALQSGKHVRLNQELVLSIRERYRFLTLSMTNQKAQLLLTEEYGVSFGCIKDATEYRTWKNIP